MINLINACRNRINSFVLRRGNCYAPGYDMGANSPYDDCYILEYADVLPKSFTQGFYDGQCASREACWQGIEIAEALIDKGCSLTNYLKMRGHKFYENKFVRLNWQEAFDVTAAEHGLY